MATKIRGITIELSADATGVLSSVKNINSELSSTTKQLNDVDKLLKLDPGNMTLLTQKTQLLQEQIGNCKEKLTALKQAQADMDANGVDKNSEQYQALQREIIATEQQLSKLESTAGSGSAALAKVSQVTGEIGDKMTAAGQKMSVVSAGIVAIGTAAVTTAANFDTSMSQVQATMGITSDATSTLNGQTVNTMEALRNLALQMGSATSFSASECADALNYLALAGYNTQEMADTLPVVLNLAAAGNIDLANASDMVTDAMSALGLNTSDATTMVDQMAKTASTTNTSVAQLGEAMLTIGGTAQSLKGGTAELSAALGILANNGIKGAEGGTHLRNVILSLQTPTDDAASLLSNLGVSVYDTEGNMRSLNDILGDLNASMDGMTQEEKNNIITKIFNKTDLSAVNALLNNTGDSWDDLQQSIENSAGSAQQMADTQLNNLQGQLTLLKSALEGLAISVGDIIMPIIQKVVSAIQNVVDWLNNLDEGTKETIVTIAAIVAAIGPLLVIGGKVMSGISSITSALSTVKSGISALGTSTAGPIGLAIAATAALVAGILALQSALNNAYKEASPFTNALNNIKSANSDLTTSINNTKTAYENASTAADSNAEAAKTLYGKLQELIKGYDGSAESGAKIKAVVGEMNELVPDLALAWDENTNSLNKTNSEIYNSIEAMRSQAQVAALQDLYTESLKEQYTAQKNLSDATNTAVDVMMKYGLSMDDVTNYMKGGVIAEAEWSVKLMENGVALWNVNDATEEIMTAIGGYTDAVKNEKEATENVTFAETELGNAMTAAAEATRASASDIERACMDVFGGTVPEQLQIAIDAAESAGVEIPQELVDGIKNGSASVEQACTQLAELTDQADIMKANADNNADTYISTEATEITNQAGTVEAAAENANAGLDQTGNAKADAKDTADAYTSTEAQQIKGQSGTIKNAAEQANAGLDQTGNAKADAKDTADAYTSTEASQITAKAGDIENAVVNATAKLDQSTASAGLGRQNIVSYTNAMAAEQGNVQMTATNIANAVQTPISQLPGRMTGYGSNSAGNFNSSVSGWAGTVQQTAFRLYEFFSNQLGSGLSSNMTTWGYNAGEKFNSGINSRSSAISTTVQAIVTGITTKFTNLAAAMQSAGTNAMINFSNGFVNKYNSSFVGYMNTIVNGIKNRLDIQNSLNILGYNAGIGFNNGLFSASSYIYSTAQTIANNVKNKISAALEINSPSKVLERIGQFTGKGFEIGLEESAEGIYSTMNDIGQRLAEGMNQDVNIGMNAISSEYSTQRAGTAEAASPELNNMATLLAQYLPYLPYLAQQTNVVLDDGTLVGKIAPAMNNALSDINRRAARG